MTRPALRPRSEALQDLLAQLHLARTPRQDPAETLPLAQALGRILAEDQVSNLAVPAFDNSQMDGYALRLADFQAPDQTPDQAPSLTPLPVSQRIPAGHPAQPLAPLSVARIFTGAEIPAGADAVVMQEEATVLPDGRVQLQRLPEPGAFIRRRGSDLAPGGLVLHRGRRLRAEDLGLLASLGRVTLPVYRRLRLAVFSSGDELVQPGQALGPGQIYDSNRIMVMALATALGFEVMDMGCLPDRLEPTREALRKAAQTADVLITCGGVSVGEEDHIKAAVSAEGSLALWKVAIKPGKPFAYGRLGGAHFMGLPGNPVAAWVTFQILARPFLLQAAGQKAAEPIPTTLPAGFDWPQADGREEFLRGWVDDQGRLQIHGRQNSQVLSSVVGAEGLVILAPGQTVVQGDPLPFLPFSALR